MPLLDVIAEVLRQPDEVWLNNYDGKVFDCLNYIRFYRDKAINVVCRIENGKTLAVRTWFEIAIRPTTRSGGKMAPEKDPPAQVSARAAGKKVRGAFLNAPLCFAARFLVVARAVSTG